MQVPKTLLEQFVSSTKEHNFAELKSLQVNESEGYIFFFTSGYQCFFMAFNGNTLPLRIKESSVKQITCDEIEAALSECGDMVDLSNFKGQETHLGGAISGLNLFLRMNKVASYPMSALINYKWLANVTSFLTGVLAMSETKEANLNISYLEECNYAFKAKTNELDFLCVVTPEVD